MGIDVKICGLTSPEAVAAAVAGGARYVGFVFFPRSPRALRPADAALLASPVPNAVFRVGLLVDPDDAALHAVTALVPMEIVQLHGKESPARVAQIRAGTGLRVMKALAIERASDLDQVAAYEEVADLLLFDARAPADATRPGGNAQPFDWTILQNFRCRRPWLLAGGLDASNLAPAVRASGARAVDVSSGVEERPGVKSLAKIARFLEAAAAITPNHAPSGALTAKPAGGKGCASEGKRSEDAVSPY